VHLAAARGGGYHARQRVRQAQQADGDDDREKRRQADVPALGVAAQIEIESKL